MIVAMLMLLPRTASSQDHRIHCAFDPGRCSLAQLGVNGSRLTKIKLPGKDATNRDPYNPDGLPEPSTFVP